MSNAPVSSLITTFSPTGSGATMVAPTIGSFAVLSNRRACSLTGSAAATPTRAHTRTIARFTTIDGTRDGHAVALWPAHGSWRSAVSQSQPRHGKPGQRVDAARGLFERAVARHRD